MDMFFSIIAARFSVLMDTLIAEKNMINKRDTHHDFPNSRIILVAIAHACVMYAQKLGSWDERLHNLELALYDYRPSGYDYCDTAQVLSEMETASHTSPVTYTAELYRE